MNNLIPCLVGFAVLWPIIGALFFLIIEPDEIFDFAKKQPVIFVREWHIFVWPVVLWLWFKYLKENNG